MDRKKLIYFMSLSLKILNSLDIYLIFLIYIYFSFSFFIHNTKKIRVRIQFIIIYGSKQLVQTYLYIVSIIIMYMFIIV